MGKHRSDLGKRAVLRAVPCLHSVCIPSKASMIMGLFGASAECLSADEDVMVRCDLHRPVVLPTASEERYGESRDCP